MQRIFMRLNSKLVHNPAADNDDNVPRHIYKNYYQCSSYSGCKCKATAYPSVEGDLHGILSVSLFILLPPLVCQSNMVLDIII
jgi:hypothetical protein